MVKKYYSINTEFIAVVEDGSIKMGNPIDLAMPCVHLDVSIQDSTISLQNLTHDESCNITNDLPHGEVGTVRMLKLAILFTHTLFPSCHKIYLQDTSGYHDHRFGPVDLSTKDMCLFKRTWYQRQLESLNLRPLTSLGKQLVNKYIRVLDSKPTASAKKHLGLFAPTVHESIQSFPEPKYIKILELLRTYHLPPLFGLEWVGVLHPQMFDLTLSYQKIKKPSGLKAQWGGKRGTGERPHLINMVY